MLAFTQFNFSNFNSASFLVFFQLYLSFSVCILTCIQVLQVMHPARRRKSHSSVSAVPVIIHSRHGFVADLAILFQAAVFIFDTAVASEPV